MANDFYDESSSSEDFSPILCFSDEISKSPQCITPFSGFAHLNVEEPSGFLKSVSKEKNSVQFNYLKTLNNDRFGDQTFCDFTIITDTRQFKVHKCLVGVASDFFKTSMTTEMIEKYQNTITVQSVCDSTMELVLNYIYGNEVAISLDDYQEIYAASDFLQISQLSSDCLEFLSNIDTDASNIASFWMFAEKFNLEDLLEKYKNFIKANFVWLADQTEILEIPPDYIETYLQIRDDATSEECFCRFIIRWMEFKKSGRKDHFQKLFHLVDLDKLSKSFLVSNLMNNEVVLTHQETNRRLLMASETHLKKSVESEGIILVKEKTGELSVTHYNILTNIARTLPALKTDLTNPGVAFMQKHLYIIGGFDESSSTTASTLHSMRLTEGSENVWTTGASMLQSRSSFGCTVFHNFIFVAGGKVQKSPSQYLRSVECYDVKDDKWIAKPPLSTEREGCCLVGHQSRIYVLGGRNSINLSSIEIFDGFTWTMGKEMLRSRYDFAAVALSNKLLAIGGSGDDHDYYREVETYDFEEKEWKYIADLNAPRSDHGACVVNGKIYVVGGNNARCYTMPTELYCSERNCWKKLTFHTNQYRVTAVAQQ